MRRPHRWREALRREPTVTQLFLLLLGAATLVFALLYWNAPHGWQGRLFFRNFTDFGADFLNPIRCTATPSPYFDGPLEAGDRIATPLQYLLSRPFRQLADFRGTLQELQQTPRCQFAILLTFSAFELLLFAMLAQLLGNRPGRFRLLALIFFSGINLAALERGTWVLLTAGLVAGFLYCYRSPRPGRQRLGLTLLCLAAALKIYPALFGLLLLRKRDYRGIAFCVVLTALLGFVPLLFFEHGFGNLPRLFANLAEYLEKYRWAPYEHWRQFAQLVLHWSPEAGGRLADAVRGLFLLLIGTATAAGFFRPRTEWQLPLAIAAANCLLPRGAMSYTQLYLLPVLALFLSRNSGRRGDYWYAVGFVLLLMPLQLPLPLANSGLLLNPFLFQFVLAAMLLGTLRASFTATAPAKAAPAGAGTGRAACNSSESGYISDFGDFQPSQPEEKNGDLSGTQGSRILLPADRCGGN